MAKKNLLAAQKAVFDEVVNEDWESQLMRNDKGKILSDAANVYLVLTNHPQWRGVIGLNKMADVITKRKPMPFAGSVKGDWHDTDDMRMVVWLSQNYRIDYSAAKVLEQVNLVAEECAFHPVLAYFDGLAWDGVPRLDIFSHAYLGTQDTQYNRLAFPMWLISAVARVYAPGSKADHVLILEGEQGIKKSSALRALAGEWFMDTPIQIGSKDAMEVIRGKLIVELAELDSLNRAESSAAKSFFSSPEDTFRASYGRRAATLKRQCVFAGTVNHDQYMKDDTGNRRYWPIACTRVDMEEIKADRDQLWAEAVARYKAGARWWPEGDEAQLFCDEQDKRFMQDAWLSPIRIWLEGNNNVEYVTTATVMGSALKMDMSKWTRNDQMRVGAVMRRLGWLRKRKRFGGTDGYLDWIYTPPTDTSEVEI